MNLIHKLEQEEGVTQEALDTAVANYQKLVSQSPPQLQLVWDNINLKTKQRYTRSDDNYTDYNLDWVASLWIQAGSSLKNRFTI